MAYCRSAGEVVMKALSVENSSPAEACELYARAIAVLLEGVQGHVHVTTHFGCALA